MLQAPSKLGNSLDFLSLERVEGGIKAGCTVNTFCSSIIANANVGSTVIAEDMLAAEKEHLINDVVFASDDCLAA